MQIFLTIGDWTSFLLKDLFSADENYTAFLLVDWLFLI